MIITLGLFNCFGDRKTQIETERLLHIRDFLWLWVMWFVKRMNESPYSLWVFQTPPLISSLSHPSQGCHPCLPQPSHPILLPSEVTMVWPGAQLVKVSWWHFPSGWWAPHQLWAEVHSWKWEPDLSPVQYPVTDYLYSELLGDALTDKRLFFQNKHIEREKFYLRRLISGLAKLAPLCLIMFACWSGPGGQRERQHLYSLALNLLVTKWLQPYWHRAVPWQNPGRRERKMW